MNSKYPTVFSHHHPVKIRLNSHRHLRDFRHHDIVGLNQHSSNEDNEHMSYEPFPYKFSFPLPVISSDMVSSNAVKGEDPALILPREKYLWKEKKRTLVNKYHSMRTRSKINIEQALDEVCVMDSSLSVVNTVQPCIIAQIGHHLSHNPDKYFKGMYNWYYGNTASVLNIEGKTYVLSPCGKNTEQLRVTRSKMSKGTVEPAPSMKRSLIVSLQDNSPVYDIVSSDSNGLIGVRQRDICSFLVFSADAEGIMLDKSSYVRSAEYPFISLDISGEEVCTVSANRTVYLWSPEYSYEYKIKGKLPSGEYKNPDLFVSAKYTKTDNILVISDRCAIYYYDKREGLAKPFSTWKCTSQTEFCENISLLLPSYSCYHTYIGLTHSLLLLDNRSGFVQKWTHMLQGPPSVGHVERINKSSNEDLLFLGSQIDPNIVNVHNTWNESEKSKSYSSPYSPPSRVDTLLNAKLNAVCLDPVLEIRFRSLITGLASYRRKKHFGIFIVNSLGDVFYQKIHQNPDSEIGLQKSELDYVERWGQDLNQRISHNLRYTEMIDMSEIFDRIDISNEVTPEMDKSEPTVNERWKMSKKDLTSYIDYLAPNILHDYGVDEMSEWGSSDDGDVLPAKTEDRDDGISKVKNWLMGDTSIAESDKNYSDVEKLMSCGSESSYSSDGLSFVD